MAGGQERLLRRRIKTIQSTQKITRAQELIAASRIARAQAHVAAAQPYSESITQVVHDLAAGGYLKRNTELGTVAPGQYEVVYTLDKA